MNKVICCLLLAWLFVGNLAATTLLREMFVAMPDSLLPLVPADNRRDCLEFMDKDMKARVRNVMEDFVELEALSDDYLRFRTSEAAFLELKLLHMAAGDTLLCMTRTAQALQGDSVVLSDSHVFFYDRSWQPLATSDYCQVPALATFATGGVADSTLVADGQQALRSLQFFCPMEMRLSADAPTLMLTVQTGALSIVEKRAATTLLQPVVMRWNGTCFELPVQP